MSRFERYAIRVISALVVVMTLWTAYRLEATVRGHNTATVCACASVPCPMLSTRTTSGIPGISVANNNNVPIPAIPASIIASALPTTTAVPPVSTTTNAPPSTTAAPTSTPSTAPLTSSQPSAVVGTAVVSAPPAKDLTTAPTTPDTRTGHDPAFVIRDAMDPEVARNTVRNDVGFSFSDRWRENIWRQQMHDYNVDQQRYSRRRRFARVPTAQPPDPPKDSADQLGGTKVNPYVPPAVPPTPPTPLAGPLCVFVPANAHDAKHEAELLGFVESWADDSTVLFSERKEALEVARVRQRNISLHHADLAAWNSWHEQTVLAEIKLRRRGATADSIRGRGQLSIPLFHWISQLVKRDDPLVQNCKWFMKCDTDTYLRRGLLEREVLNKLDHTKPYHVGVPLKFNTRPYHHTLRTIEFEYNIGGPGYTFSRGLMASVDTAECVRSMTSDPVLLIHDDVATGFCATYYSPNSALVEIRTAISSSAGPPVTRLLTGKNKIVVEPNGYVADVIRNDSCVTRFTAAHPVEGVVMRMLAHHDRELTGVTREPLSGRCDMKIMAGADVKIGGDWTMDRELRNMFDQWRWLWIDRRRHFVSEEERPRVENALDLHKILFEKD